MRKICGQHCWKIISDTAHATDADGTSANNTIAYSLTGDDAALFSIDVANGTPHKLVGAGHISDFSAGKDSIVFAWENLGAPADLFSVPAGTSAAPHRLTQVNEALLGRRKLSEFEQFNFKGWNDETVHGCPQISAKDVTVIVWL